MVLNKYICVFVLILSWSCQNDSKIEKEISKIEIDFDTERFDRALKNTTAENLGQLKKKLSFLFWKKSA